MSAYREWLNSLRRYTEGVFQATNNSRWPNFGYLRFPRRFPMSIDGGYIAEGLTSYPRGRGSLISGEDILGVTSIQAQIAVNCRAHHSDRFSASRHGILIVRRGQTFHLVLQLTSQFRTDFDQIQLVFTYSGSRVGLGEDDVEKVEVLHRASRNSKVDAWSAQVSQIGRKAVSVEVTPSVKAPVGEWKLVVITQVAQRSSVVGKSFSYTAPIYILFNPWSPDDAVYLPNANERDEYVLADSGIIYSGGKGRIRELAWVFGQHEHNVLAIVCNVLRELAYLDVQQMADPIQVSRAISSIINGHSGRQGIIQGNWSDTFDDYEDSRSPWEWTSSVEILELFHKTRSVIRYGQCFVFAGVCNTMCRALGLPARCVTNYRSAHDVNKNLTLDYFVNENDETVLEASNDSIWSFHVWNEVWMKRKDLTVPGDFDGWQVVDATPQVISNGEFRVGPCSVKAVRRGEVDVNYDGVFVLSEVNADVVYYRKLTNGQKKEIKRLIDDVGFAISTKGVLNNERVDITNNYKPREGTTAERQIYQRALRKINPNMPRFITPPATVDPPQKQISFELKKPDERNVGQTMRFVGIAKNKSSEQKFNVRLLFTVKSRTYAATYAKLIKVAKHKRLLQPRDAVEFDVIVNFSEYASALKVSRYFFVEMQGIVEETNDHFVATDEFFLTLPKIFIACDTNQKVGRTFNIKMSLKNPLPVSLKNATFAIEAPGITKQLRIRVHRAPRPGEYFSVDAVFTPRGYGKRNLVASFHCDELHQISEIKQIYVAP